MKEVSPYLLICFVVGGYLGFSLASGPYMFGAAVSVVIAGGLLGLLFIIIANQAGRIRAKFARPAQEKEG